MQRTRVSQGKLNEYCQHEPYYLRNFFMKYANFVRQFLKNARHRIHVTLSLDWPSVKLCSCKEPGCRKENSMSTAPMNVGTKQIFCEIYQLCKPISQKRIGQDSRNSYTWLTFSQSVFMQRTNVSQGKLNWVLPARTVLTQKIFYEICQLCKTISQKRTGQDSRNSVTGLTFSQTVLMQRIRVSQGKLNEYRHHET